MKYLLLIFLAVIVDPTRIGKINTAKNKAKEHFQRGEYQMATTEYRTLIDSMGVKEDELTINLAHSYFHLNDTVQAQNTYLSLVTSLDKQLKSVSFQQLGVMANRMGKAEQALDYFRNALKANTYNEDARYNYEMLKKKLEKQKQQQEQEKKNNQSMKPSEFAKKLKAQADEMVSRRLYKEAHDLMVDGLRKDKSVAYYNKFIERTKEVAGIK